MFHRYVPYTLLSLTFAAAVCLLWQTAGAGPPLLCHPLDIGRHESLPWGSDAFAKVTSFDREQLIERTVEILDEQDSALVHMETLRRAMIYASEKESDALSLLAVLIGRALDAEGDGRDAALARLDAGYAAQGLLQLGGVRELPLGAADGIAGYGWITQALQRQPDDAEMHFAAAMVTALAANDAHRHHVDRVHELSRKDSLVRRNLENRPHLAHGQ